MEPILGGSLMLLLACVLLVFNVMAGTTFLKRVTYVAMLGALGAGIGLFIKAVFF